MKIGKWILAASMCVLTALLMSSDRSQFLIIFPCFALLFGAYIYILKKVTPSQVTFWVGVAIAMRVVTIFFFPNLSDDIYRFIWDGQLLAQGLNPFDALPSDYIKRLDAAGNLEKITIDPELYGHLNSPDYFTIYPPISQLLFFIGAKIFFGHWLGQAIFLKAIILICEIGSISLVFRILKHYQWVKKNVLLYALNPLVIVELTGNIHFEGVMIFFFLWTYWLMIKKNFAAAGWAYGMSFLAKLVSVIGSIFLLKRLHWRSTLLMIITGLITVLIGFFPLLNTSFTSNFGESLNLYFQKFEFNASIYYLAKWIGYQWKGFNMIANFGPLISILGVLVILIFWWRDQDRSKRTFPTFVIISMSIYLLFSTTVHPWYLTTILAFSVFTRFRFPMVWSCLIFMTYINYSYPVYRENLWVVGFEYLILFGWMYAERPWRLDPGLGMEHR